MESRKVYHYLKKLSVEEWRELKAYLESPLLGSSPLYGRFLEVFHTMRFEKRSYAPNEFHEKVYPREQYPQYYTQAGSGAPELKKTIREGHMKRHLNGLLEKLFDFWGFKEAKADVAAQNAYRLRGMAKYAEVEDFERAYSSKSGIPAGDAFRNGSWQLSAAHNVLVRTTFEEGRLVKKDERPFQQAIDQLDEAYWLVGLELACIALSNDIKYPDEDRPLHTLPRFLNPSFQLGLRGERIFGDILLELYQMYLKEESLQHQHYEKAKCILMAAIHLRNPENSHVFEDLFAQLINFAGRQHTQFPAVYIAELHTLYVFALEQEVFIRDGYLSRQHYQNIAFTFIKFKSYTWTAEFLEKYKAQLPAHLQEPMYHFNLAVLQFAQSNFKAAWRSLNQVDRSYQPYEHVEFTMQFKAYQLVMEYEMGDYERLGSRALSFKNWLGKGELDLPKARKALYLCFVRIMKKLGRLSMDWVSHPKPHQVMQLQAEVEKPKAGSMLFGSWLLGKLGALKTGGPSAL